MRWLVLTAVLPLLSGSLFASEPVAVSLPVTEAEAPIVVRDLTGPSLVVSPPAKLKAAPEIRPADRPKLAAKKPAIKKSLLSRTERNQIALLAVRAKADTPLAIDFFGGDDAGSGPDNLDLHRSFSRPKPVKELAQDDDEDIAVPDHVALRLLLARMKAVEAHNLAQAANQSADEGAGLSEAVKLRLAMARMKAVQAHQKKFS